MPFTLTGALRTLFNLAPPDLDAVLAGPCSTTPHTVTLLHDSPGGPRVISAPDAGLVVGVAPHGATGTLLALPHFTGGVGYALLAPGTLSVPLVGLRPGETLDAAYRLAQHRADPPAPYEQVMLVGPSDPVFQPFGRDDTVAVQWLLYERAVRAGRVPVHGAPAQRPVLLDREPDRLRRWAHDLAPLLVSASPAFAPAGGMLLPRTSTAPEVRSGPIEMPRVARGYRTSLPPGLTEGVEARHYTLSWRDLLARATVIGDWTVVHAGALVDPVDHPGVQSCIADKRQRLRELGLLQRAGSLLRLTCDVAVPSLTNALRLITGTNEPGRHWQRAD